jgi:hypothetical protein
LTSVVDERYNTGMDNMVTLRDIRKECGLTLHQVLERMAALDAGLPRTHPTLHYIETQGTQKIGTLRALAVIYGRPLEEIERASLATKKLYNSRERVAV